MTSSLPDSSPAIASISSATSVTSATMVSSFRILSLIFSTTNVSSLGAFR